MPWESLCAQTQQGIRRDGEVGVLPQEATMLDKVLRGWLFLLGQAGGPKPAEWKYLRSGVMVWPL